MLVKFSSPADAPVLMLGDSASTLLEMMGQSGQIPGALAEADVPAALSRLQSALAALQSSAEPDREGAEDLSVDGPSGPAVSMQVRAYPLLRMLERAIAANAPVIWELY